MRLWQWLKGLVSREDIRPFIAHIEAKYGRDLARILVRTRLRGEAYENETERRWLEEKLKEFTNSP